MSIITDISSDLEVSVFFSYLVGTGFKLALHANKSLYLNMHSRAQLWSGCGVSNAHT